MSYFNADGAAMEASPMRTIRKPPKADLPINQFGPAVETAAALLRATGIIVKPDDLATALADAGYVFAYDPYRARNSEVKS